VDFSSVAGVPAYGHCVALGMAAENYRKSVPPYCYQTMAACHGRIAGDANTHVILTDRHL